MMFDVDCPQTPDGNSPKTNHNRPQPNVHRITSNTNTRLAPNRKFVPRARSTSYDHGKARRTSYDHGRHHNGGLEPEATVQVLPRTRTAPSSGPALYGRVYHAAPASNNPFDNDVGGRARTHSDSWWKEDIVDESDNKEDVLDGYYGLSEKDKQEFYGKSNNPFEDNTVNRHGHTSFSVHRTGNVTVGIGVDQDGSVESSLVEKAGQYNVKGPYVDPHVARQAAQAALQRANQGHPAARYGNDSANNSSLYQQANAMRSSGQYQVDDYSFSTINIHNIPKDDVGIKKADPSSNAFLKMPKWMEGFAPGASKSTGFNSQEYGIPAPLTAETNIAPPIRGNHQDWWSTSPKVTFDTDHHDKRHSRWSHLSHSQKIGAGLIWVALMATLMGVTIWSMNKPDDYVNESDRDSSSKLQGFVSSGGAHQAFSEPTTFTLRPTRQPATRSPIDGYASLHGKGSNTTPRPSRNPTTKNPSNSPVVPPSLSPSQGPTSSPSSLSVDATLLSVNATELVQPAPESCNDNQGYYLNHLFNPKDCEWLSNDKEGYTDRKDKNCGTALYPRTDLGAACPGACALYNGCAADLPSSAAVSPESSNYDLSFMSGTPEDYLTPTQTQSGSNSVQLCSDGTGTFKNHLDNDKDCDWLSNDKAGQTERKDKNCGYGSYPITELGQNCPQTCIWYNKVGCSVIQRRSIQPNFRSTDISSTACVNGSGKYANHHGDQKQCHWLREEDEPEVEKFRRDKNCGTHDNFITDLGKNCPWECREYNGCNEV